MCDKCVELDKRIEHYQAILARMLDARMTEGLARLIDDLLARKAALHPEPPNE